MTTRIEARFGETSGLGTTYTKIGASVTTAHKWNLHFNIANRTATPVRLRLFIASSTWTSGEPTSTALKVAVAYDLFIAAKAVQQITGVVALADEQIVARSDTATSLDIAVSGVDITI